LSNRFVWIAVFATCAVCGDWNLPIDSRENRTPPDLGLTGLAKLGLPGRDQHCDRIDADRHAGL